MTHGYQTPYRRPLSWKRFRNEGSEMLSDLNRQINNLFDDVFDFDNDDNIDGRPLSRSRSVTPAVEVAENDEHYLVTAELPGVQEEDIELSVDDGVLKLTGEKKRAPRFKDTGWTERSFGMFQRMIQLPQDIDEERIEAEFIDGVLAIELPRTEVKAKGRRIALKTHNDQRQSRLMDATEDEVSANA